MLTILFLSFVVALDDALKAVTNRNLVVTVDDELDEADGLGRFSTADDAVDDEAAVGSGLFRFSATNDAVDVDDAEGRGLFRFSATDDALVDDDGDPVLNWELGEESHGAEVEFQVAIVSFHAPPDVDAKGLFRFSATDDALVDDDSDGTGLNWALGEESHGTEAEFQVAIVSFHAPPNVDGLEFHSTDVSFHVDVASFHAPPTLFSAVTDPVELDTATGRGRKYVPSRNENSWIIPLLLV